MKMKCKSNKREIIEISALNIDQQRQTDMILGSPYLSAGQFRKGVQLTQIDGKAITHIFIAVSALLVPFSRKQLVL